MDNLEKKITIIASAEMGPGTFEAKFMPLSRCEWVDKIFVVRKNKGPNIDKMEYIIVNSSFQSNFLGLLIRPLYLFWYSLKYKADIILAYHIIPHAFFAFIVSFLTKKKLIIAQTGLFIQDKVMKGVLGSFMKVVFRKSEYFFVPGSKSLKFWSNFGVQTEKIKVLHSTIDTDHFKPDICSAKKYDFIILSRLVDEKRVDILIDVLSNIDSAGFEFKAVIVGDGYKYNDLVKLVSDKNLKSKVDFVGFQSDTKFWFNQAKYYLMYSSSEGLPTSLMQAMSCGLVPITTDAGNISDLVNNNNGFIFSFEKRNDYTDTLKYLLSEFDTMDYEILSAKCRESVVRNHSFQSAVRKWNDIFNELSL